MSAGVIGVFVLAAALLAAAVVFFIQAARRQRQTGLPAGKVVYSDTGLWREVEKPLFDSLLGLTGRPDYVVDENGRLTPVEVKSTWAPPVPYDSHMYQLAAYCLLVEKKTGVRPAHGLLHYRNRTLSIPYSEDLETRLLDLLAEMRLAERRGAADRSHEDPARCARCGYRSICDQRL